MCGPVSATFSKVLSLHLKGVEPCDLFDQEPLKNTHVKSEQTRLFVNSSVDLATSECFFLQFPKLKEHLK